MRTRDGLRSHGACAFLFLKACLGFSPSLRRSRGFRSRRVSMIGAALGPQRPGRQLSRRVLADTAAGSGGIATIVTGPRIDVDLCVSTYSTLKSSSILGAYDCMSYRWEDPVGCGRRDMAPGRLRTRSGGGLPHHLVGRVVLRPPIYCHARARPRVHRAFRCIDQQMTADGLFT